jgi:hypothetical protein
MSSEVYLLVLNFLRKRHPEAAQALFTDLQPDTLGSDAASLLPAQYSFQGARLPLRLEDVGRACNGLPPEYLALLIGELQQQKSNQHHPLLLQHSSQSSSSSSSSDQHQQHAPIHRELPGQFLPSALAVDRDALVPGFNRDVTSHMVRMLLAPPPPPSSSSPSSSLSLANRHGLGHSRRPFRPWIALRRLGLQRGVVPQSLPLRITRDSHVALYSKFRRVGTYMRVYVYILMYVSV